eukprot:scaffold111516_cov19-Tisochrysis_lutea.AAC.1
MSTKRRTPPTTSGLLLMPTKSSLLMSSSSDPLAAKTTSASSTHLSRSDMRWMLKRMSGYSAARASARGRLRFKSSTSRQPLLYRCFTNRVDILPAPMMHARASSQLCVGSLSWASSTAAELTDTEPVLMEVSARTRLPAVIACLKRPFRERPKPGQFWPTL